MQTDKICFKYGHQAGNNDANEAIITQSMGVLTEDGVYAFFLFLDIEKDKSSRDKIKESAQGLLSEVGFAKKDELTIKNNFVGVTQLDIDDLIYAKGLLERMLVYARYHSKVKDKDKQQTKNGGE